MIAAHLRLVTDDDIPPDLAPPGQQLLAFARLIAPDPLRQRYRGPNRPHHRVFQRDIPFGAPRKGKREARPRSMGSGLLTQAEREELNTSRRSLAVLYAARPLTVGDCREQGLGQPGAPCPWVSCRHHNYLEVKPKTGTMLRPTIKLNFPGRDVDEIPETCSIMVGGRGGHGPLHGGGASLEAVGRILNLTMERARQVEAVGLGKVRAALETEDGEDDDLG